MPLVNQTLQSCNDPLPPKGVPRGPADVSQHPLPPRRPAVVGDGGTLPQALLLQPPLHHSILLPCSAAGHLQRPLSEAGPRGLVLGRHALSSSLSLSHPMLRLSRPQVQALFRREYGEVVSVGAPTRQERSHFFQDLVLRQAAEALPADRKTSERLLPVAVALAPSSGAEPCVSYGFDGGNAPPPTGRSWWGITPYS